MPIHNTVSVRPTRRPVETTPGRTLWRKGSGGEIDQGPATRRAEVVETAHCLAFEPEPVAAFLHRLEGVSGENTSVLICAPFGWDEMCSYRGRRTWARELARSGITTARFDFPSTGDSGGGSNDPDLMETWTAAVGKMAEWLRSVSGTDRVAVLGIGLGGMLACRAVDRGARIDELILWAVPSRGRTLLRELRAHASVIAQRHQEDHTRAPARAEEDLDVVGYRVTKATASSLASVDLAASAPASRIRRVLLLNRDGIEVDARLRRHFESGLAEVSVADGLGYGELMAHPQESRILPETISTVRDWLLACESSSAPGQEPRLPSRRPNRSVPRDDADGSLRLRIGDATVRETTVSFDFDGCRMFGVLSEPEGTRENLCLVLLNAGALRHIGPHRTYVEMARRWSARGVSTLRVDLRGIGEADDDDSGRLTVSGLSDFGRIDQTTSVLRQLEARGLPPRFILAGLCGGAHWSLHTALADPSVKGALMINLYAFRYSEALVTERERRASTRALRGGIVERAREGRLRREHIARGLRSFDPRRPRLTGRDLDAEQASELERALDQIGDRSTMFHFLFSRGEPMLAALERGGQRDRLELLPNVTFDSIPSRDHMYRALWLQSYVQKSLNGAVERVLVDMPVTDSSPAVRL